MIENKITKLFSASVMSVFLSHSVATAENTRILDSTFDRAFNDERTFKPMNDDGSWVQGWIAESYFAPIGVMMHNPVGDPIDTWRDSGRSFFTTDFMYAFDQDRIYVFNAGTLRHGAIRIDKIGNYRLHGYIDRYYSFGQPNCSMKLAIDGTTIFDQNYTFEAIKPDAIITKGRDRKALADAYGYKESSEFLEQHQALEDRADEVAGIAERDLKFQEELDKQLENEAASRGVSVEELKQSQQDRPERTRTPEDHLADALDSAGVGRSSIFEITEAGYYNLNVWIFCKDVSDAQHLFNNANMYGLIQGKSQKKGMLAKFRGGGSSTYEWSGMDLNYGFDKVIIDGMEARRNINAIKASIAENFGTFGELVLENVDTGKKARITGETIFHKKEFTPRKDILRPSISPKSAIKASNWHFKATRGRVSDVYVQEGHEAPIFTQAIQNFDFKPTRIMARKKIILPESGVYGVGVAFNPIAYNSTFAYYMSGAYGRSSGFGDRTMNPLDMLRKEVAKRPVSDYITIYIQRRLNNGRYERQKFFEGQLKGAGPIGELQLSTQYFDRGQYELIVVADPRMLTVGDRLGNLDLNLATNSSFSFLLKTPSSDSYKVVR